MSKKEAAVVEIDPEDTIESEGPPPYEMPLITVGEICLYYPHGYESKEKYSAFVTRVSQKSVELVCQYGHSSLAQFEVHHINDPDLKWNVEFRKRGAWDYSDNTRKINELAARIAALEELVK